MTGSARALLRAWGPATLWLAVLFILSHQPNDAVPGWWSVPDVVSHLVLYSVLGALLAWGRNAWGGPSWGVLGSLGILWAISDEWHQSFVPGRTPSLDDLLADAAGLLVGALCASLLFRILTSPPSGGPTAPIDAAS